MIRERKKIILIVTRETESAMKRVEDEPKRVLEMAMKVYAKITYSEQ